MTPKTEALLNELEAFVWYRTDELDDEMIEKLVEHIKYLDAIIEGVRVDLKDLNETLT